MHGHCRYCGDQTYDTDICDDCELRMDAEEEDDDQAQR
jgi:hypothetical protein